MADHQNTTTDHEEDKTKGEDASEEMSLESLDKLIADDDPEFAAAMNSLSADNISGENLGEDFSAEYCLEDEIKSWKQAIGFRSILFKLFPIIPNIIFPFRKLVRNIQVFIFNLKDISINSLKEIGPWSLKKIKHILHGIKTDIHDTSNSFKGFNKVKKALTALLLLLACFSGFVIYRIVTDRGLLPHDDELFINNLDHWADSSIVFDPNVEMESFYDSMHGVQNVLEMTKMVVNVQRSASSGENPMGAFEFVIEGSASEAVIEVKDREAEMRDLFQRTIEELTYDQLSTTEGKQLMCDRIRKRLNVALTKGKIRRVFIKTSILKP